MHRLAALHFKQIECPFEHLFTCSSDGIALHAKQLNVTNNELSEVAIAIQLDFHSDERKNNLVERNFTLEC